MGAILMNRPAGRRWRARDGVEFEDLIRIDPLWLCSKHPFWVSRVAPDVLAQTRPDWMADVFPEYMVEHRPFWMAEHRRDTLGKFRGEIWMKTHYSDWVPPVEGVC